MTRLDTLEQLHAEAQGGDYAPVRVEVLGQLIAVARAADGVEGHSDECDESRPFHIEGRRCTCGRNALREALAPLMEEVPDEQA